MSNPYARDCSYGNLLSGKANCHYRRLTVNSSIQIFAPQVSQILFIAELNKFSSRSFGINAYRKEESMKKEQIRNELFKIEVLRQRLMRPQFIALGLTVGQGQPRILKELLFEGSMTQKKLADACLLDVTTMSRTLDRMEQAGLLVRESNPDCRRSWLIALTDKGTDIAKKVQQIFEETDKIYCSNLSEKEAEQLFVLLQKVADNISQNCK
jgi:DNA-binding MarR family transcriptional regulator